MSIFLRHTLWTTLCPGTVTLLIPYLLLGDSRVSISQSGWMYWTCVTFIGTGVAILFSCIFAFAKFGKGTLSPFDPARHLVIKGLYRYVRNPMYVGVLIILFGEALFFQSLTLFLYALVIFFCFNVFIILYEEPYLRNHFGEAYEQYQRHVGRWIPGKPYP